MYLLDTNIISETIKKKPNPHVLSWLSSIESSKFFLSVLTMGEIRKGIEKLEDLAKKQKILQWLEEDLVKKFYGRIISIDIDIADKWGYISSLQNLSAIDALIAATAIVHNHRLRAM
ncbi:MAG: PIN domain-containing protein [Gammaproteobacteria bacterium]